ILLLLLVPSALGVLAIALLIALAVFSLALTIITLAAVLALAVAVFGISILGIAAHRLGNVVRVLGHLVLRFGQGLFVGRATLCLGTHALLIGLCLGQHFEKFANAFLLGFQLGIAIVVEEQSQDGVDVLGEHLAPVHRIAHFRQADLLGIAQQ